MMVRRAANQSRRGAGLTRSYPTRTTAKGAGCVKTLVGLES